VLTLMQTSKSRIVPVVLLEHSDGRYWETWMEFERLLKLGFMSVEDLAFFKIKHSAQEAAAEITEFYNIFHSSRWERSISLSGLIIACPKRRLPI
jgi:hypothetical protein